MPKSASTKTVFAFFCMLHFVCCEVSAQMLSSCLQELDLNPTDFPSFINDNMKRGCLDACIMQKMGLMNDNVINMEKIDEYIDEYIKVFLGADKKDIIRQNMHQCVENVANDDKCMVAENFVECGLRQLEFTIQKLI
ncbi:uncharacterized protein LOC122534665 [Frieseomelitta varia]|uniref:uncharacterized protein LOC122534665 n=1 Tax=Frieseomelitta varia TaxID=561572 RepID=UPI001CB6AF11|nr:uncharacterized protein LOC122534665 [Frieseomelitta varia]